MTDPRFSAFVELYAGLPRQGPGSATATLATLELVPELSPAPRIVDAGCGSGAATVALAQALPGASILAVDLLELLLDRLGAVLAIRGLGGRVQVRRESMDALSEPPASVDLIWSEGAIYNVGVERALACWRPLLRPGACVVFSEACWWVPAAERPPALAEFWAREYPQMRDEAALVELIAELDYDCLATRRLEPEAWSTDYYEPLARRCAELKPSASPIMSEVIAAVEAELACFASNAGHYGYTFFVVRPRS